MAFGLVYLIIDGTNDKEYVGQTTRTVEERFQEHKWCQTSNIGRAIRKHGAENFTTAILKVCDSQEELNYWEKHFIASRGTRWPEGYNNSDGGEGGWERTPESIAKMSRKGKHHSEETKAHLSKIFKGKPGTPHTAEMKAYLSAICPNKRKVICIETGVIYDSVSEAARSINVAIQTLYRACKKSWRLAGGFHWRFADAPYEETESQAIRNPRLPSTGKTKARSVVCVETGEIFDSLSQASHCHNIDRSSIAKVCKGTAQTAGGFHWKLVEESNEASTDKEVKHLSAEHKALLSSKVKTKRPVCCVELCKTYESITEAARCHGTSYNHVKRACNEHTRTANGYHWRYVD